MNILNNIRGSKLLYQLLGVSLLLFIIKGVSYALIGSYIPIIFISTILLLFYWSFTVSQKNQNRIFRFWAILIIIWALVRLGLWMILKTDSNLTESHLREQFGPFQHIISIIMLLIGFGIIKQIKQRKTAVNSLSNENC